MDFVRTNNIQLLKETEGDRRSSEGRVGLRCYSMTIKENDNKEDTNKEDDDKDDKDVHQFNNKRRRYVKVSSLCQ